MATKTTKTKKAKSIKKTDKSVRATSTPPANKKISFKTKFSNLNPKKFIVPALIILVILFLGVFRNQFISATVNGEQISRLELLRELEKTEGQRVLQNLITQKLIDQEAEKRNITVSEEELDQEVSKIETSVTEQGQNLDNLLAVQNFTRQQLREQLRSQLLLQKMVNAEEIVVTDEEVNQYIEQNQDSFPEGTNPDEIREDIREQLKQQKVGTGVQNLLTELQSNANIEVLLN